MVMTGYQILKYLTESQIYILMIQFGLRMVNLDMLMVVLALLRHQETYQLSDKKHLLLVI